MRPPPPATPWLAWNTTPGARALSMVLRSSDGVSSCWSAALMVATALPIERRSVAID